MTASTLDIVLPCYNPSPGWEDQVIESFKDICSRLPHIKIGLIIVNDGSVRNVTEETIHTIKNAIPIFAYLNFSHNMGKGYALRKGISLSTAEICIYTDIDFPYTTESVVEIFNALYSNSCTVAAGIKDSSYYAHVPPVRRSISKILRWCIRFFLRIRITDTQCGLKGFTEEAKKIFLRTTINRYLFDLEFIFLASRMKNTVLKPIEIHLREGVEFTSMPLKLLLREAGNFMKIFLRSIFTR